MTFLSQMKKNLPLYNVLQYTNVKVSYRAIQYVIFHLYGLKCELRLYV